MRRFTSVSAVLVALSIALPARAETVTGAVLAGREAMNSYDFAAADGFFSTALGFEPGNLRFADGVLTAKGATGDFAGALPLARSLSDAGENSPIIGVTLLIDAVERGDWAGVKTLIENGDSPVPVLDDIFLGWAEIGQGNMEAGLGKFDELIANDRSTVMAHYHRALALGLAGDMESALQELRTPELSPALLNRRGLMIEVEVLSALERNPEAVDLIDLKLGLGRLPPLDAYANRLRAGEPVPFTAVRSARDGFAEIFFTLVSSMDERTPLPYVLAIGRAALELRPDHTDAKLLVAGLLENMGRYDEAIAIYDSVPEGDFSYHAAQLGRADALAITEQPEAAAAVLNALAETYPDLMEVYVNLGDLHRMHDEFEPCVDAYDKAVSLFRTPEDQIGQVYFYRGICLERLGEWPSAEADLRYALELLPNHPSILNYLGYSLVEKREKLDEALTLIERAVQASPDSGFIVDSLGWALYRLGRFDEAVAPMERAVALTPTDPVINDHLGDVYWAVGRKREAEFQWKRALSYKPEEPDLDRIRRKLDVGLDAVLKDEASETAATQSVSPGDL